MKRYIFVLFFASIAQVSYTQEFTLGVKGGVTGYTLAYQEKDIREEFRNSFRGGYFGGILVGFPLPDNFSLVSEAMYARKGRRVILNEAQDGAVRWINKSNYDFLEFAVVLRKKFPVNLYDFKASWYFNVGPNISYWMGGTGELTTNLKSTGLNYDIKFIEELDSTTVDIETMYMVDANRWLFGLDFGVGFETHVFGNQRFYGEVRFTYGHTYLGESYTANLYVLDFDDNMRNAYRSLSISVGYGFAMDVKNVRKGKSTIKKRKQR